jgi:hypothetical protein
VTVSLTTPLSSRTDATQDGRGAVAGVAMLSLAVLVQFVLTALGVA